jgi:cytochrome c biogenesis protein CcmG, thiol:disulfide interchange protein DsbE
MRWLGAGAAVVVALAVVLTIVLLGRGGAAGDVAVAGGGAPRAGELPPQFSGTAVDGTHFDLAAERGRVVVVNFFATWCENCRAELPLLERTYRARHGAGLDVVTVDFNDGGDARAFLAPYGITFPALLDPDSRVGHAYLVSDLPVSVFVGRDGRVARVFHGQLSDGTLSEALAGLL